MAWDGLLIGVVGVLAVLLICMTMLVAILWGAQGDEHEKY